MFAQGVERKPGLCLSLSPAFFFSLSLSSLFLFRQKHTHTGHEQHGKARRPAEGTLQVSQAPFLPQKVQSEPKIYTQQDLFSLSLSLRRAITTHTGTGRETKALIHFSAIQRCRLSGLFFPFTNSRTEDTIVNSKYSLSLPSERERKIRELCHPRAVTGI